MKLTKLSLTIIAAAGLLSLAPTLPAQTNDSQTPSTQTPRRRGGMNAETRLAAFEKALGSTNKLSEAQAPKVKAALEDQSQKMRDLMAQRDSLSQEEMRSKRQALTQEFNGKMKAILNPEQYKVWEQMARRGRGARRPSAPGAEGAGSPPKTN